MKDQSQAEWLIQVFEGFKKSSHMDSDGTPIHLAVVAELRRLLAERDALMADAERWRMLPAFFEEYQIDALQLYRDIDAAIASKGKEGS